MSQKQQHKDKKRKKRVADRKAKMDLYRNFYFHIVRAGKEFFPYDMHQQLKHIIKNSMHTNKQWRNLQKEKGIQGALVEFAFSSRKLVTNPEAFAKYYPRILIKPTFHKRPCILIMPHRVNRHFVNDNSYYYDLSSSGELSWDIPEIDGKKVVFTKHAVERFATRFQRPINGAQQFEFNSLEMSMFTYIALKMANENQYLLTHETIDGRDYLHCQGDLLDDSGFGYFPLVFRDDVAVCKTFLFEDWVDEDICDEPETVDEQIDQEINKALEE